MHPLLEFGLLSAICCDHALPHKSDKDTAHATSEQEKRINKASIV